MMFWTIMGSQYTYSAKCLMLALLEAGMWVSTRELAELVGKPFNSFRVLFRDMRNNILIDRNIVLTKQGIDTRNNTRFYTLNGNHPMFSAATPGHTGAASRDVLDFAD
jgi:hypothetical protein